jgi:hypothetical protein
MGLLIIVEANLAKVPFLEVYCIGSAIQGLTKTSRSDMSDLVKPV